MWLEQFNLVITYLLLADDVICIPASKMAAVDEAVSKEDSSSSTTISPIVSQIFRPNAQGLCDIMGYRYSLRELLFYLVHTTFFIAYVSSYTPHE